MTRPDRRDDLASDVGRGDDRGEGRDGNCTVVPLVRPGAPERPVVDAFGVPSRLSQVRDGRLVGDGEEWHFASVLRRSELDDLGAFDRVVFDAPGFGLRDVDATLARGMLEAPLDMCPYARGYAGEVHRDAAGRRMLLLRGLA